jgi:hypothetical protein
MTDNNHDIAIGPVGIPNTAALAKKPPHLVVLLDGKEKKLFLSLDKPELLPGFIQVKGFYVSGSEDDASKNYVTLMGSTAKDLYYEMCFPVQRVHSIKNLMFKAK